MERDDFAVATRGYLFLDVDGILNPEARRLHGFDDWEQQVIGRWRVWTSVALGTWLRNLIATGVQIVWATTWIEAPDLLRELAGHFHLPLDLPRLDSLEWPDDEDPWANCGKRPGVLRWLVAHGVDPHRTPVAWADDCLGPDDHRHAAAAGIHAVAVPASLGLDSAPQRRRIEVALGLDEPARQLSPW